MNSPPLDATTDPLWKRFLLFVSGIGGTVGFSYFFDYVIYPIVTYQCGVLKSFLILFAAACFLNWVMILFYDLFKKDLFGFEAIKQLKASGAQAQRKTWLQTLVARGDWFAFIVLSVYDPFLATLYKRDLHSSGLKPKDYGVLVVSTAVACLLWSGF